MSLSSKVLPKLKNALQLRRALCLVWESGPRWTIASVFVVLVQGVLPLLALYLTGLLVQAVNDGASMTDKDAAFHHALVLVVVSGAVALGAAAFDSLSGYVNEGQSQAVTDHMNTVLHAKAIEVDLEYYENADYHDKMHRAQEEAPYRPTHIVRGLTTLGQSAVTLIAIGAFLLSLHWGIILVLVIAAIPGVLVRLRFINIMYKWQRERTLTERKASYFHWMLTLPYWAKEVRLFDLGPLFMGRFRDLRGTIRREKIHIAGRRAFSDVATQTFAILPMFACYAYIAYETLHGAIKLGYFVMYTGAFRSGQSALNGVFSSILGLHEDNTFLTNLYEFLDLKPKVEEAKEPVAVPRPMREGIVFDHVSFGYATSSRQALRDVSLRIAPGEVVALVGENGSGKTTLVKLLCRLYDPTGGSISVDGVDLRQFKTRDLRREISVIFQDYVQYDLTARENIWLGNLALPEGDSRVEQAAHQSGAGEVVDTLPQGYDTVLGRTFEGGEELSIGQWQKVALARAFLRDSQLIILDEPTSALDPKAEYEVFEKFRELVQGQAAILISHRLSTVKMADRICVMKDGEIVEDGTHDALMARGGFYAHLFETQAQAYK